MKLKPNYIKLTPAQRLYQYKKPLVALTGGIASGKSTVVGLLEQQGLKIIDADKLVKSIYEKPETQNFIKLNYPEAWEHDEINFTKLRTLFFSDTSIKEKIETYIYQRLPLAFEEAALKIQNQDFYIYDVPLLFERGLNSKVDLALVVYAPREVQLARLLARDGTKNEIGNKILEQQIDIEEKKRKADFVINNTGSLKDLAAEVQSILLQILE